jgi:hypothetical protein
MQTSRQVRGIRTGNRREGGSANRGRGRRRRRRKRMWKIRCSKTLRKRTKGEGKIQQNR